MDQTWRSKQGRLNARRLLARSSRATQKTDFKLVESAMWSVVRGFGDGMWLNGGRFCGIGKWEWWVRLEFEPAPIRARCDLVTFRAGNIRVLWVWARVGLYPGIYTVGGLRCCHWQVE